MYLYHLNPHSYGQEWFVMASNKTEAFNYILKDIKTKYRNYYNYFKKTDPLKPETFPEEYTLDEYETGKVIRSEIS